MLNKVSVRKYRGFSLPVYEIACKLQHECPYNDLTKKLPEITFAHWCNHDRDVIDISCEEEDLSAFKELQKDLRSLERALNVKNPEKILRNAQRAARHGKVSLCRYKPERVSGHRETQLPPD